MYYTVIKHSGHLRTLEKCRKHSPAAHVSYISLVFSNARRVLSQCNTRLRLLYLLIKICRVISWPHTSRLTALRLGAEPSQEHKWARRSRECEIERRRCERYDAFLGFLGASSPESFLRDRFALRHSRVWLKGGPALRLEPSEIKMAPISWLTRARSPAVSCYTAH